MSQPTIGALLKEAKRPLLSFEFFPPRDATALKALRMSAVQLQALRPDFVTVTCGAGGSAQTSTLEICNLLRDLGHEIVMPHQTCVGLSRAQLEAIADDLHGRGFYNIMTLRGDAPKGVESFQVAQDGLAHASELVTLLKNRHPDFCCGVAGYPEVHPEAASADIDLMHLKHKVECGADFITTQLFFDNDIFYRFVDRCRAIGITCPILPGLLPAISLKQIQRLCSMCRSSLPIALGRAMEAAGGDGEAAEYVGIRWAERQIENLLQCGAQGIHLYILNRSRAVLSGQLIRFFDHARLGA